jgi:hypothetical protein
MSLTSVRGLQPFVLPSFLIHFCLLDTPGGRQRGTFNFFAGSLFLVEEVSARLGPTFTTVQGVTVEDTGIRFSHKAGKDHDRFVFVPDKSAQSWFFSEVAAVVKSYNIRRRMDN